MGKLLERSSNPEAKKQIELLNKEIERLQDKSKMFDPNTVDGKDAKKYDLVIMLDTPTEGRSSRAFKPYFENAKKIHNWEKIRFECVPGTWWHFVNWLIKHRNYEIGNNK